jgi:hypothetical protein
VNSIDDDESSEVAILHVGWFSIYPRPVIARLICRIMTSTTFAPQAAEQVLIGQTPAQPLQARHNGILDVGQHFHMEPKIWGLLFPVPKL